MRYKGEYKNEISFPIGGIGSGSIGLCGDGLLRDWEIFNTSSKNSINGYSHFVVIAEGKEKRDVRVIMSDYKTNFTGMPGHNFGYGVDKMTMVGFPHFKDSVFNGEFPIATIDYIDSSFNGKIKLTAFNPMIPLNEDDSSIPAGFFEFEVKNTSKEDMTYTFGFNIQNPFIKSKNRQFKKGIIFLNKGDKKDDVNYGDLTVITNAKDSFSTPYWYRGGLRDGVTTYWRNLEEGSFPQRDYKEVGSFDHGTLFARINVKSGRKGKVRFVLSWNIPNRMNTWNDNSGGKKWKNYYATVFKDSKASAKYGIKNFNRLYKETKLFKDSIFKSSLDNSIKDAISSTMSVLKTPTVLRLENGEFYGFEGLNEKVGSCEGTCQHVWAYAYALCFLFPSLERTIRDYEYKYSMFPDGNMQFRIPLPLGSEKTRWHACLDGQMSSVFKCYREWKLSGDNEWLKEKWPYIKKAIDYATIDSNEDKWDYNADGVLEGRQHHTLDLELFGPSSWLQGMYVLALKTAYIMGEFVGDIKAVEKYKKMYENGYKFLKKELFNGEYFIQKVDIKDKSILEQFGKECVDKYYNAETQEIKYQIANGSIIDQMLAKWHANILGVDGIFDEKQVKTALQSMYKNHFFSMRNIANTWRIFALNDEKGAVICRYPKGVYKPSIPISYTEECMTGFEYSFAGLLISEGFVKEGISIVKAIRERYDGKKRNPWNEIEYGSNYARPMSSFALIPIFLGFKFDLSDKMLGFNPIEKSGKLPFFVGTCYGNCEFSEKEIKADLIKGNLILNKLKMKNADKIKELFLDGKKVKFKLEKGVILFDETIIEKQIYVKY